jgi:hypothetical protein
VVELAKRPIRSEIFNHRRRAAISLVQSHLAKRYFAAMPSSRS